MSGLHSCFSCDVPNNVFESKKQSEFNITTYITEMQVRLSECFGFLGFSV